jgi:hypothetical protein
LWLGLFLCLRLDLVLFFRLLFCLRLYLCLLYGCVCVCVYVFVCVCICDVLCLRFFFVCFGFDWLWLGLIRKAIYFLIPGNAGYLLVTKHTIHNPLHIGFSQRPVLGLAGTASYYIKACYQNVFY